MEIKTIMSEEEALDKYKTFCSELDISNLDDICGNDEQIKKDHKKLLQAIRCGLVYIDSESKFLVQQLKMPLKSGDLTPREKLVYKNKLTSKDTQEMPQAKGPKALVNLLAFMTSCPLNLLNSMEGFDFEIALACVAFFE